ncbi:uncharacterized protein N7503_012062 [Penicillium pulvis]|uniref:uncharacterized protein n=1 Tax=Penicillium pulvis TaxID=1562058 RepID=UPI002546F5A4|nr:uncharacterized protein N7503_012062 [Penicillium pulvis]KAJ5786850.1 hypothetical protein N7503_012062 [Penicillium pulvis]
MISHQIWYDFECGKMSHSDCYNRLAEAFSIVPKEDVSNLFKEAKATLKADAHITDLLRDIKRRSLEGPNADKVEVYLMSNMSKEDIDYLQGLDGPWNMLDGTFASGYAGMRKPDSRFFEYVLKEIHMDHRPEEVLFIDDQLQNIEAAEELGIRGVQCRSGFETAKVVRELLGM